MLVFKLQVLGRSRVLRFLVGLLRAWVAELLGVAVHLVKDVLGVVELLLLLMLWGGLSGVGHGGHFESVVDG